MDKKLVVLGGIVIVTFLSFMTVIFLNDPITRLTRAANPTSQPSASMSLIFAWPLNVAGNGKEKSTITVFIRDSSGRALEGKEVRITSSLGAIANDTATTDTAGKATFTVTSNTPGISTIEATVDTTKLLKKVTVQFK